MSKLDGIKVGAVPVASPLKIGDKATAIGCLEGVIIGKASNGHLVMEYSANDDLGSAFIIRDPSCFTHA